MSAAWLGWPLLGLVLLVPRLLLLRPNMIVVLGVLIPWIVIAAIITAAVLWILKRRDKRPAKVVEAPPTED